MGARTSLFTWQNPPFIYLFIYIYNYYEFYKLYPVILHKIQFSPTIFTFIYKVSLSNFEAPNLRVILFWKFKNYQNYTILGCLTATSLTKVDRKE